MNSLDNTSTGLKSVTDTERTRTPNSIMDSSERLICTDLIIHPRV